MKFKVKVDGGTAPYTHQWIKGATHISGATSATLSYTVNSESDFSNMIYCIIRDSAGNYVTTERVAVKPRLWRSKQSLLMHVCI